MLFEIIILQTNIIYLPLFIEPFAPLINSLQISPVSQVLLVYERTKTMELQPNPNKISRNCLPVLKYARNRLYVLLSRPTGYCVHVGRQTSKNW